MLSFKPDNQISDFETLLSLPSDYPELLEPAHVERIYQSTATQGQRVQAVRELIIETSRVFMAIGLPTFIESATLIGFHRDGDVILWDDDADMGYLVDDSRRR